jgi:hypothetical protein
MSPPVFHERQSRLRLSCAVHALNNLLGKSEVTVNDLAESPLDKLFGYFDVQPMLNKLGEKGLCVRDHILYNEKRPEKMKNDLNEVAMGSVKGILVNVKQGVYFWQPRHWYTINKDEHEYWNSDSKLKAPQLIGGEEELKSTLISEMTMRSGQIFFIVKKIPDD